MLKLAFLNLWHRKIRSALSVLAVAIGVMMLVVLVSLSRGSVDEVRRRFESVDAEMVLTPENFQPLEAEAQLATSEARAKKIRDEVRGPAGEPLIRAVIPVLVAEVTMSGQRQRVFGIHPAQWDLFAGNRRVIEGRPLGDEFEDVLRRRGLLDTKIEEGDVTPAELASGRQLLIDDRLAHAGRKDAAGVRTPYKVGDTVRWLGGHDWTIVGIVETGVAGRVFAPIATLRYYSGSEQGATVMFVKLTDPERDAQAEEILRAYLAAGKFGLEVQLKNAYGKSLMEQLRSILLFTDVISAISLMVSFLVILLTIYTMVVERTHEIGILRSLGAGRLQVMGEILLEAELISVAGVAAGIGLSYAVAGAVTALFPLLTVDIRGEWLLIAVGVGVVGGAVAALVPAWSAARADPVEALGHI